MTNAFNVKNCSNIGTGPQNSKPPYCLGQITYDFSLFVLLKSSALSVKMLSYTNKIGGEVGPALSKVGSCGGQVDLGVGWGGIGEAWVLTGRTGGIGGAPLPKWV